MADETTIITTIITEPRAGEAQETWPPPPTLAGPVKARPRRDWVGLIPGVLTVLFLVACLALSVWVVNLLAHI